VVQSAPPRRRALLLRWAAQLPGETIIATMTDILSGKRYDLMRRFLLASFLCVATTSVVSGALLSRFLTERMLARDAEVTQDFVQSIVHIELAKGYKLDVPDAGGELLEFFKHMANMPDVVRANVYARDGTLVWSSDSRLATGRKYGDNPELSEALEGHLETETGIVGAPEGAKDEHRALGRERMRFVETYVPLREAGSNTVIGVAEVYRVPDALSRSIDAAILLTWMIAIGAGLFLYATLFWIVRRADQLIRAQQERLVDNETMGALGEMASAVAHGVRNPLSSIRSSAELWQDTPDAPGVDSANDIVSEVQRIEAWIRELLTFSQPHDEGPEGRAEAVDARVLVEQCIAGFAREARRRQVNIAAGLPEALPRIRANPALFTQALNNVVSNALEAMPPGGGSVTIEASAAPGNKQVSIRVADTGTGIAPEDMDRICQPFFTTKAQGLGVGLTLVRRIVRRFGGAMDIESSAGRGTVITLTLPTAS
jgi:signal transduction histidine kinase